MQRAINKIKLHDRGFINMLVAVVLMLAVFVAGGIVFWKSHDGLNIPVEKACPALAKVCPDGSSVGASGPNCEFAACPSAKPLSMKTYTNIKYGYLFQYPSDVEQSETSNGDDSVFFQKLNPKGVQSDDEFKKYFMINIRVLPNQFKLTNDLITKNPALYRDTRFGTVSSTEKVLLSSIIPYNNGQLNGLTYPVSYDNGDQSAEFDEIVMVKGNYIYQIDLTNGTNQVQDEGKMEIQKILSTFQFAPDTTGWKTYTNSKYGLEMKYPTFMSVVNLANAKETGAIGFIPVCNKSDLACFEYPSTHLPQNPNFEGAGVSVSVDSDLPNKALCENYTGQSDKTPLQIPINGTAFYAQDVSDGATGHTTAGTEFHSFHNSMCYKIRIASDSYRCDGVEQVDSKTGTTLCDGKPEVDEKKVLDELKQVVMTFKFN